MIRHILWRLASNTLGASLALGALYLLAAVTRGAEAATTLFAGSGPLIVGTFVGTSLVALSNGWQTYKKEQDQKQDGPGAT